MSYVISVCTPFRMYHGGYHWMNFHESWKVGTSIKVWRRTQFLFFNIGQKIGQVTGSPDTLYCCQRGRLHEAQTLCIVVSGAVYMKPRNFVLLSAGQFTWSPDTLYCCQRGRLHETQTLCVVVSDDHSPRKHSFATNGLFVFLTVPCISTAYMEGVFASPRQQWLLKRAIFWKNLLLPSSTQLTEVARTFTKAITFFFVTTSLQNDKSPDNFHNHHKMYCWII